MASEALSQATRDAEARGLRNVRYQLSDIYDLPFEEGSFDVAYAHQVIQHLLGRTAGPPRNAPRRQARGTGRRT